MTHVALIVLALLAGAADVGRGFSPAGAPALKGRPTSELQQSALLYVCIQDDAKIAVVDMEKKSVVRTIDLQALGFTATAKPHFIVVEPGGAHWYVSLIGANAVLKFDAQDRIVGRFEMETPGMLALSPAGDRLLVSRSMSAVNPPKRIAVIDPRTMKGDEVDVLFPRPHPMAVTKAGFAYTGSLGLNQIASIALDGERVQIVPVGGETHSLVQFALSPDESILVASAEISGQLLVFDLAAPATPKLIKTVPIGKMAFDPVFTPDGRFVYVPVKSTNEIAVVDVASGTVTRRLTHASFKEPHQVVFSPDGWTAFVTNNNKMDHMADPAHAGHAMPAAGGGVASLSVIDVRTGKIEKAIELGKNLTGMGQGR
jgi:DNA-binding beta-propeller fold protein YncE